MDDDKIVRRAYPLPPDGGNGKRKAGRPKGSKTGGRDRFKRKIADYYLDNALVDKAAIKVSALVEEESRLAFSDIRRIPGCPQDIPDDIAPAIRSFQVDEIILKNLDGGETVLRRTTKYQLWDKGQALERLGRHLGMFERDNRQKALHQRPQINLVVRGDVVMPGQLPLLPDVDGADGRDD